MWSCLNSDPQTSCRIKPARRDPDNRIWYSFIIHGQSDFVFLWKAVEYVHNHASFIGVSTHTIQTLGIFTLTLHTRVTELLKPFTLFAFRKLR